MRITKAAIDAALIYMTHNPNLSNSGHEAEVIAMLEAAMPHIRTQIAEEIIAKQASHDSTLRVSPPHFEYGFNTGMKYAARIAEGESK